MRPWPCPVGCSSRYFTLNKGVWRGGVGGGGLRLCRCRCRFKLSVVERGKSHWSRVANILYILDGFAGALIQGGDMVGIYM